MFCLTKHDSLIVQEKDLKSTMEIIDCKFKNINLDYVLDITTPRDIIDARQQEIVHEINSAEKI